MNKTILKISILLCALSFIISTAAIAQEPNNIKPLNLVDGTQASCPTSIVKEGNPESIIGFDFTTQYMFVTDNLNLKWQYYASSGSEDHIFNNYSNQPSVNYNGVNFSLPVDGVSDMNAIYCSFKATDGSENNALVGSKYPNQRLGAVIAPKGVEGGNYNVYIGDQADNLGKIYYFVDQKGNISHKE